MSSTTERQHEILARIQQLQVDLTDLRVQMQPVPAACAGALQEAHVSTQNAFTAAKEAAQAADAAKEAAFEGQKTRKVLVEFVAVGTGALLLVAGVAIVFSIAAFLQARAAQRAIQDVRRVLLS